MKTIANIAIIGLASALRIAEEGRTAEPLDTGMGPQDDPEEADVDYCAKIADIPEDATWEQISGMITEETGEVMTEEEFNWFVNDCFGDEEAGEGSNDEEGTTGGSDTSSIYEGSSDGSLTSDDPDADSETSDDDAAGTETSDDDGASSVTSDDDGVASSSGESVDETSNDADDSDDTDSVDHLFDSSDDSHDSEEEFAYWCERINGLPEGATWDEIESGLIEEFGEEDVPAQEEFIAVSWACGAVEHGTEMINDFEDVCDAIVEHVPEGAAYADVVDFLVEELGDDAPTEEEWDAINWACTAAAEYDDYYGEDYGEDEDDKTPATTEAQIKDDDMPTEEEMRSHCGDLAHLADEGVLDGEWEDILAHIIDAHGADGAPTQAAFEATEAFCAGESAHEGSAPHGSAKPHEGSAAQTKEDDSDDDESEDDEPTEEELLEVFAICGAIHDIPAGAKWNEIHDVLVEELDADDVPTEEEWPLLKDFCHELASM